MLPLFLLLIPAAYQVAALYAGLAHLFRRITERCPPASSSLGVSVLKPLRGLDPNTQDAFRSQVRQNFPCYEVLFGVTSSEDLAVPAVRALEAEVPNATVRLFVDAPDAPNGKVGVLTSLARRAKHHIWVVNDSDILVDPLYLTKVTAPLQDPEVGVVTCLYRARAHTAPAAWEAFGIAVDFMPSTLVAPLVGVRDIGLGSTLAFRAEDLRRAGGFESFSHYLADDYQLAKRICSLGKRSVISTYVVETAFADDTWRGVWNHQLRWARTIRLSKGAGYAGLPITHAGLWMAVLVALGVWPYAAILWALRTASALVVGGFVLQDAAAGFFAWLAPVWDLFAFTVWLGSYGSRTVEWRGKRLSVDAEGRIRDSLQPTT